MNNIYITTLTILLISSISFGQTSEWESRKNKDGIEVFTRDVENSGFKEFKGVMTVPGSMREVVYIIKDTENARRWLHNCKSNELLEKKTEYIQYNYTVTDMPFPFEDRDMVFKINVIPADSVYTIYLTGIPDHIPEKKGITRMHKAEGTWILNQIDDETVHITYSMHVEPGGSLPSWLVNTKVTEIPYETLRKLRKLIVTD